MRHTLVARRALTGYAVKRQLHCRLEYGRTFSSAQPILNSTIFNDGITNAAEQSIQ
jgi:hypothetical protein